mmetsp:Transcript_14551/g.34571  ORF Transcript_14551/g.34571 Transcript_14551/m.34571 type:complete len:293 (+) Transcript_14551:653-1531(+)
MWREGQSKALGLGITHSAAVNIYVVASEQEALPFDLRHLKVVYRPFELTSFALSLLLVFRTEASYARWEAARSNWMTVITACRNLSGLGRGYSGARGAGRVAAVCRWTAAYAWCLKDHLQPTNDLRARLQPLLSDGEAAFLLDDDVDNRPRLVLCVLTQLVNQAASSPTQRTAMLEAVTRLEGSLTDCERILKTPIPLGYTRQTSRFLIVYLTFLPFALWDVAAWGLVPISAATAFFLLGIDEIGVQIEEPFSIMPLENFCESIEKDVSASKAVHSNAISIIAQPSTSNQPW